MDDLILQVGVGFDEAQGQRAAQTAGDRAGSSFSSAFRNRTSNLIARPLGSITGSATEFQKSLEASNARVIAFGASAGSIFILRDAFRKLVSSTIEVQQSMAEINSLFRSSPANIQGFSSSLFKLANDIGVSFTDASKAALVFAHHGLDMETTLKRTASALALSRISGLSFEESVLSLTAVINSFTKELLNNEIVVEKLAAVGGKFAASEGEIAEALKRVGASANDANVSFNETIALITAAQQATSRGGSVIGNSFKSIFTRLQRPQVLDDLESAGIKVRDLNGKILPLVDVLKNLANSYDTLSSAQKSFVSEMVGGVYQANVLKAILQDIGSSGSVFSNALQTAENATDSLEKRLSVLNATISTQLVRTMNDLTQASSNIGNALLGSSIRQGIDSFDKILNVLSNATDAQKARSGTGSEQVIGNLTQGALKGIGNIISGPGLQLGISIVLKLFEQLVKFIVASGKDIVGLDQAAKKRAAVEGSVTKLLQSQPDILKEILSGQLSINDAAVKHLAILKEENAIRKSQGNIVGGISNIVEKKVNIASDGFIPNFGISSEINGARSGGYISGKVIQTMVNNGIGSVPIIANTAETIARFSKNGKEYDFINPPLSSQAGKSHMMNAITKTGINPYGLSQNSLAASGFIPSLALKIIQANSIEDKVRSFFGEGKTAQADAFMASANKRGYLSGDSTVLTQYIKGVTVNKAAFPGMKPTDAERLAGFILGKDIVGARAEASAFKNTSLNPQDIQSVLSRHGKEFPLIAAYASAENLSGFKNFEQTLPLSVGSNKFTIPVRALSHSGGAGLYGAIQQAIQTNPGIGQALANMGISGGLKASASTFGAGFGGHFDEALRNFFSQRGIAVGDQNSALDILGYHPDIAKYIGTNKPFAGADAKASATELSSLPSKIFRTLAGDAERGLLKGPTAQVPPLFNINKFNNKQGSVGILDADAFKGAAAGGGNDFNALIYAAIASGKPLRVHYGPQGSGKTTAALNIAKALGGGYALGREELGKYSQFILNKTDLSPDNYKKGVFGLALASASHIVGFSQSADKLKANIAARGRAGENPEYLINDEKLGAYKEVFKYLKGTFGGLGRYSEHQYSGGFIPNLGIQDISTKLGAGAYGIFYKYNRRPNMGFKKLTSKNPMRLVKDIADEYNNSLAAYQLLKNEEVVSAPKVFGTLSRSLDRNRIGKEVVEHSSLRKVLTDFLVNNKLDYGSTTGYNAEQLLRYVNNAGHYRARQLGVSSDDAHPGNTGAIGDIHKFLKDHANNPEIVRAIETFDNTSGYGIDQKESEFLESLLGKLKEYGVKLKLIDLGLAEISPSPINKTFGGFIPNLSILGDALDRENRATGGYGKISRSPLLASPENPLGLAAIDARTQGNAGIAINQHMALGQSLSQIRKAHTASTGFIPNLANESFASSSISSSLLLAALQWATSLEGLSSSMDKQKLKYQGLFSATDIEIAKKRAIVTEYQNLQTAFQTGEKTIGEFGGKAVKGIDDLATRFGTQIAKMSKDVESHDNTLKSSTDSLRSKSIRTALITPFVGGFLSQIVGNRSASGGAAVDELSAAATTAAQTLATFPSRIGKTFAVGIGTAGIVSALDVFSKGIENAQRKFETQLTVSQKLISQLDILSQSINGFNTLVNDSHVGMDVLVREQRKYSETLVQLQQTEGGSRTATRLLGAPDDISRLNIIAEEKARQQRSISAQEGILAVQKYSSERSFSLPFAGNVFSSGPLSYSNENQKAQVQQLLRGTSGDIISNLPNDFKKQLENASDSLETFNQVLESTSGEGADTLRSFFKGLKQTSGQSTVDIFKQQIRATLANESVLKRPDVQANFEAFRGRSEERQRIIDDAQRRESSVRRLFVNQGSLAAGNGLDVQQNQAKTIFDRAIIDVERRRGEAGLNQLQYNKRSNLAFNTQTDLQQIEAERQNQVKNVQLNTSKDFVSSITQNFDELLGASAASIKNISSGAPGSSVIPNIGESKAILVEALNTGLSSVFKDKNLEDFKNPNGNVDFNAISKAVAGASSGNSSVQSSVFNYLKNRDAEIDILKRIYDSNIQIKDVNQEASAKSIKALQENKAAQSVLDFEQLSSTMGGIKNLLDRNFRRTSERDLVRGTTLALRGNTEEARGIGASTVLKYYKENGVEINPNAKTATGKFQKYLIETATKGLESVNTRSASRILNSVGRLTGDSLGTQALGETFTTNNIHRGAIATIQGEFPTTKPGTGTSPTGNIPLIDQGIKDLQASYIKASKATDGFAASIKTTAEDLKKAFAFTAATKTSVGQSQAKDEAVFQKYLDNIIKNYGQKYPEIKQQANIAGSIPNIIGTIATLGGAAFQYAQYRRLGQLTGSSTIPKGLAPVNKPKGFFSLDYPITKPVSIDQAAEAAVVAEQAANRYRTAARRREDIFSGRVIPKKGQTLKSVKNAAEQEYQFSQGQYYQYTEAAQNASRGFFTGGKAPLSARIGAVAKFGSKLALTGGLGAAAFLGGQYIAQNTDNPYLSTTASIASYAAPALVAKGISPFIGSLAKGGLGLGAGSGLGYSGLGAGAGLGLLALQGAAVAGTAYGGYKLGGAIYNSTAAGKANSLALSNLNEASGVGGLGQTSAVNFVNRRLSQGKSVESIQKELDTLIATDKSTINTLSHFGGGNATRKSLQGEIEQYQNLKLQIPELKANEEAIKAQTAGQERLLVALEKIANGPVAGGASPIESSIKIDISLKDTDSILSDLTTKLIDPLKKQLLDMKNGLNNVQNSLGVSPSPSKISS